MKWPWPRSHPDAEKKLELAQQRLEQVRGRWPQVREAARVMQRHREINGFAEAIRTAMGVRK